MVFLFLHRIFYTMHRFLPVFFFFAMVTCAFGQDLLVSEEAESRAEFIRYFSQPVPERRWEIVDTVEAWKRWDLVENFSFGKDRGSIPMIADLQSLHPYFRDKVLELIRLCKSRGIELAIVETYRTATKQNEYRSMGRKYTRVRAGFSNHQYGLAVDIVPVINSVPQWHNIKLWKKLGPIGERLGLRWGGRWGRFFDPGHFEWTAGTNSYSLRLGKFPAIPKPTLYPCMTEDLKELQRNWRAWESEQSSMAAKELTRRASSAGN
jgi:hypothetical protein